MWKWDTSPKLWNEELFPQQCKIEREFFLDWKIRLFWLVTHQISPDFTNFPLATIWRSEFLITFLFYPSPFSYIPDTLHYVALHFTAMHWTVKYYKNILEKIQTNRICFILLRFLFPFSLWNSSIWIYSCKLFAFHLLIKNLIFSGFV